jgi:hypothetical protein
MIIREVNNNDNIEKILISPQCAESLMQHKWRKIDQYIRSHINGDEVLLHRFVMNAGKDDVVDHINNNTMDNRLDNLRLSTPSGNSHNKVKKEGAASQYNGVFYNKTSKMWFSYIRKDGVVHRLSSYKEEIKAAIAYNLKAKELYGEFANLNSIPDDVFEKYQDEVKAKIEACKKESSSGYKGINWNKEKGKWHASFIKDKKHYFVGYFDDMKEAILAFNAKTVEVLGENNRLLHVISQDEI